MIAVARASFWLILLLLLVTAAPARAEVAWIGESSTYQLTGAQLFALRDELPPELEESLKAIRNVSFGDGAAFGEALGAALLNDAFRAEWHDRLIEVAEQPGVAYGAELREDMLTLYVAGSDHALDGNAFTSKSWLAALPEPGDAAPLTASFEAGCLAVRARNVALLSLCEGEVSDAARAVTLHSEPTGVYGLGQEFLVPGETAVDRLGEIRTGLNQMSGFNGGANGNTLFPIAYFDHPLKPLALILDNRYPQHWDFSDPQAIRISVTGGDLRLHLLTGETLADIRRQYMVLTGFPPVPPKSMFGLWISEYGYDNWAELDDKIATLEANDFPLSGVVMDLQWFGGIEPGSPKSRMGTLSWDREAFPDPEAKIADLASRGIAMMLIEESYISRDLEEFATLSGQGFLAHGRDGTPMMVSPGGNWWGLGGMLDWSQPDAREFWHDFRRQPLVDAGIAGHWTDLGEPEMFHPDFLYGDGLTPAQVHNSYNLLWLEGIADGYRRKAPDKRPFMMARSGGMGMQALGAAMWSGDTGSDFGSLATQMEQQAHMMWSGLDYYGSDVGGFHRGALSGFEGDRDAALDELYTQWFAYSAMFEVPVRPHTENLCNCKETAPDRIGDLASNRANIVLRYQLLPYYYSLAHQAFRSGEPVFPTLDYWFPGDPAAKELGHEKMIGPMLVAAAVAEQGATSVDVYLPEGDWYDFRTHERIASRGQVVAMPLTDGQLFQLPLLVRDGGLVPVANDAGGMDLMVFGEGRNTFNWFDDDGSTTAYRRGSFEQIEASIVGGTLVLNRINGSDLQPRQLTWVIDEPEIVAAVLVNGESVPFTEGDREIRLDLPEFTDKLIVDLVW